MSLAPELRRGLMAMAVCALSVFSLLCGIGSWMAGSPPPVWFPWRAPWIALNLVVGLGTIPVWWKLGMTGHPDDPDEPPAAKEAVSPDVGVELAQVE